MTDHDRTKWNERYRLGQGPQRGRANRRLESYADHVDRLAGKLTGQGIAPYALDIACGIGGTALWLARRGWHVTAVDVSNEALEKASAAAVTEGLERRITLLPVDLNHGSDSWRPAPTSADLVTCFYYLNRELWPALRAAVRPGGVFIHETFNVYQQAQRRPSSPDKLLQPGELLAQMQGWEWKVLDYQTHGPDAERPFDAIVAQRPQNPRSTHYSKVRNHEI